MRPHHDLAAPRPHSSRIWACRIRYQPGPDSGLIGCTLIIQPVFFPRDAWIPQPDDWRPRTQTDRKYDLATGEGRRAWEACLAVARELAATTSPGGLSPAE